jgi:hypothetical protein
MSESPHAEKHWTVRELAESWNLAPSVVSRLFREDSEVLKIGHERTRAKRGYLTLRIPDSTAARVYRLHCSTPGAKVEQAGCVV